MTDNRKQLGENIVIVFLCGLMLLLLFVAIVVFPVAMESREREEMEKIYAKQLREREVVALEKLANIKGMDSK